MKESETGENKGEGTRRRTHEGTPMHAYAGAHMTEGMGRSRGSNSTVVCGLICSKLRNESRASTGGRQMNELDVHGCVEHAEFVHGHASLCMAQLYSGDA